ncbi:lysozyme inhibitor LprI family protein [Paenibacillus daejeonensis]|uniref:lysozyme inhibitor LprI family protein n=1 Tax=Paenibacillus daejeonensis TaxID=135193 RepID=UPI00037481D2|nr:lysozyme inhibitor LprI family protein [Paenibacillus daejeonensis]
MKKQIFVVLLAGMLLAGCGNATDGNNTQDTTPPADTGTNTPPPPPPEDETPPVEEPAPDNTAGENGTNDTGAAGSQAEYRAMLDDIEANMDDVEAMYEEGTTASMREAAGEEFQRWDDALNEIYMTLEEQLSDVEMDQLREEQREWTALRDEQAEEEAAGSEGGTLQPVEQMMAMASMTKERCYELVDTYMS